MAPPLFKDAQRIFLLLVIHIRVMSLCPPHFEAPSHAYESNNSSTVIPSSKSSNSSLFFKASLSLFMANFMELQLLKMKVGFVGSIFEEYGTISLALCGAD